MTVLVAEVDAVLHSVVVRVMVRSVGEPVEIGLAGSIRPLVFSLHQQVVQSYQAEVAIIIQTKNIDKLLTLKLKLSYELYRGLPKYHNLSIFQEERGSLGAMTPSPKDIYPLILHLSLYYEIVAVKVKYFS